MDKINQKLIAKTNFLPLQSGVYIWKDKTGAIIYIGKAKNLRNRIRSYLSDTDKDPKTVQLVHQIDDIDYVITNTEAEAFILESNLIKQHRPKYNILLKDDKRYPFIKITVNDPFPRIIVSRELVRDGSKYFGPYTDSRTLRHTLKTLEWIFPIRNCNRNIPTDKVIYNRACINLQLHKCFGPCIGKISQNGYRAIINGILDFLHGRYAQITEKFREKMIKASEAERFEEAAEYRDKIMEMEKMQKHQIVFSIDQRNIDIIGIYKDSNIAVIVIQKMVSGKLMNQENYPLSQVENASESDILAAFLKLYYAGKEEMPEEILLPIQPAEYDDIKKWLGTTVLLPLRGDKLKLLALAKKNAFHYVEEIKLSNLKRANRTIKPIQELKEILGLNKLPRRIACIDISTIQGSDTVSSAVYFSNGKQAKKYYRRYIIRDSEKQNDFSAISETVTRFMAEVKQNSDMVPDLIIIDGGKGQLSAAKEIIDQCDMPVSLISLAKRIEEIFVPDLSDSLILPRSSLALRLIISIRDEAHRFAVNFHRSRRKRRTLISELEEIKSVGDQTKFMLLKALGSVEAIKQASFDELTMIKGIGPQTARRIVDYFAGKAKESD